MINSKDIKDLHPTLQRAVHEFLKRCAAAGLKVMLTSTLRDNAYQQMLFDKHNGTTKARGGHSWHNYGLAFDICKDVAGHEFDDDDFFSHCAKIWKEMGGQWGAEVNFSGDTPHLQFSNGLSIADLLNGKRMPNVKMKWETVVSKPTLPTDNPVLKLGSIGNDVKMLQTALNAKGFKCGTPDGTFGADTVKAVKAFQTKNKLTPNGVVDYNEWVILKK